MHTLFHKYINNHNAITTINNESVTSYYNSTRNSIIIDSNTKSSEMISLSNHTQAVSVAINHDDITLKDLMILHN